MSLRLAYDLDAAAEVTSVSASLLLKAIKQQDPDAFPPPLKAKRNGHGQKAKYLILDDDLRDWLRRFPEG